MEKPDKGSWLTREMPQAVARKIDRRRKEGVTEDHTSKLIDKSSIMHHQRG